jgi:hypothetical protein
MPTALSSFLPLVAPKAPGAPDPAIERAVRQAAIEFCSRTLALQRTLATIQTVADQQDYTASYSGEVVHRLLSVRLEGDPLELLKLEQLDPEALPVEGETPTGALLIAPTTLRLHPTPTLADEDIVVRAAMRPSQAATTIDDGLYERYAECLADGALSRLLLDQKSAYYDPNGAGAARARFDDSVGQAKAAVFFGHARTSARARINWC